MSSWMDITVADAAALRDFYARVAGWEVEALPMGDYDDYVMSDDRGRPVAGICHQRGPNAGLPPVWLPYVQVPDLEAALAAVRAGGGEVVDGPKPAGDERMAVIRDPAGAHLALISR